MLPVLRVMPLPLAHPAAALPLRRFCPRYLALPALMLGSLTPDFAYVADYLHNLSHLLVKVFGPQALEWDWVRRHWDWDDLSHTPAGTLLFGLPAGWLVLGMFFGLRESLVSTLPNPHRDALRPLCERPRGSWRVNTLSLLLGIVSHVGWDHLTNADHWLARHWAPLKWTAFTLGTHHVLVYRVIWGISSIGGIAALAWAYFSFIRKSPQPLWSFGKHERPYYALWAGVVAISATIAFPLTLHFRDYNSTLYNLIHQWVGLTVGSFCIVGLLICTVVRCGLGRHLHAEAH